MCLFIEMLAFHTHYTCRVQSHLENVILIAIVRHMKNNVSIDREHNEFKMLNIRFNECCNTHTKWWIAPGDKWYFIVNSLSYKHFYELRVLCMLDEKFNILFSSFCFQFYSIIKCFCSELGSHESMLTCVSFSKRFYFTSLLMLLYSHAAIAIRFSLAPFYPVILHFSHECKIFFDGYHSVSVL